MHKERPPRAQKCPIKPLTLQAHDPQKLKSRELPCAVLFACQLWPPVTWALEEGVCFAQGWSRGTFLLSLVPTRQESHLQKLNWG